MAVGFKPAGGIRTAKQSLEWLSLMKEELGDSWLQAELFRFGASSMLGGYRAAAGISCDGQIFGGVSASDGVK